MNAQVTSHVDSRANFISNPSEGALGCLVLGPRPPRGVHTVRDLVCIKQKEAAVSRGDRGEVTGPGCRGRAFLESVLPCVVSATGVRGTLACLGGFPSELARGPGTRQATQA